MLSFCIDQGNKIQMGKKWHYLEQNSIYLSMSLVCVGNETGALFLSYIIDKHTSSGRILERFMHLRMFLKSLNVWNTI